MSKTHDKTLHDLEWPRIEQAVRAHRRAPETVPFVLPLATTRAETERSLDETDEALSLMRLAEPLPLDGLRDIGQHLMRVERHGDLDVVSLNEVRVTLSSARVLRKFLNARRGSLPALSEACALDPTLDRLSDLLDDAFDPAGTLADHASAELKKLRIETRNLRANLIARLEELVHKHAALLSDTFYTLRDGRYVLPVRSDAHERVHGLVHGTSSSGATIFVEPRSLIQQGNRLKLAEAEQEREENRILAALSDELRQRLASVRAAYDALLHADLRNACALLCQQLAMTRPVLSAAPSVRLRGAKHPMLLLEGIDVVPNEVEVHAGHALVISGPNAGGKTVALKLLGLAALMVRAGLFVPAAEGSECGFFHTVVSDIGDEQSLEKSLSTFSAHVTQLREILKAADEGVLVLLDELAGSTDPDEGAALACAVTEALCARGAAVAVTTHYEPLKSRALADPRMRNASVGFDVANMLPTFSLRLDLPGASSALSVAERFGLPRAVIERARQVVPEQSKLFDSLVRKLEAQLGELDAQNRTLAADLQRAKVAREEIERELAAQKAREKKQLAEEAKRLFDTLRSARNELDQARKELRQDKKEEGALRDVARRLERVSAEVTQTDQVRALVEPARAEPASRGLTPDELTVGKRVYVPRLRAEVEIVEPVQKGRIRVAAGAMRLWVDVADVRGLSEKGEPEKPARRELRDVAPARSMARSSDNSADLRGMRVDDALDLLESFLDRMYGRDERVAFIDHGVGSGALRDAVRQRLGHPSPYVESFRPGTTEEGGDRLTVIYLR
jgi:DNA mismatch repair protein MutS2